MDILGIAWSVLFYLVAISFILFPNKVNQFRAKVDNQMVKFFGIKYKKINAKFERVYEIITTRVAGLVLIILASFILYLSV